MVREAKAQGWIGLSLLGLIAALAALIKLISGITPNPTEHALGATAAALLTYITVHASIGILFLISNLLRIAGGFVSPRRIIDLRLTSLWLDYTIVTGAIALALVLSLPSMVGLMGAAQ